MNKLFSSLRPEPVWAHFSTLCEIPRASLHEAALIGYLLDWAGRLGINAVVDGAGNLLLKKPASPGFEEAPGVILQGHLDMVCQSNAATAHDFLRDSLPVEVRDGWVIAPLTTLGADNGIGVALALAALEDETLLHPALEVLLTVNEESGMDGARALAPGTLHGKMLINLDTEEWGHFYLGCAGGVDVEVERVCQQQVLPQGYVIHQLGISGLLGGHSGIDIHLGRANAIRLLAAILRDLSARVDLRLIAMHGGTARNAIPREAYVIFALPAGVELAAMLQFWQDEWRMQYAAEPVSVTMVCLESSTVQADALFAIDNAERDRLLSYIDTAANGVAQVSDEFAEVVDTSDNLGVVSLALGRFQATFKVRSLKDERGARLADQLVEQAVAAGLQGRQQGAYPGWTPNPRSALLRLCQQVYTAEFGQPAGLQVIHAGLECGLLAASHPHLDMISFGPDIRGAHAPGERVEIASVARCWTLLKAVLEALARNR